jgi:hypothetical protein
MATTGIVAGSVNYHATPSAAGMRADVIASRYVEATTVGQADRKRQVITFVLKNLVGYCTHGSFIIMRLCADVGLPKSNGLVENWYLAHSGLQIDLHRFSVKGRAPPMFADVFGLQIAIVIFHDSEQSDAHRPDTAGQGDSRKATVPTSIGTRPSAIDLFLTSIRPGGNAGERAKLPENPGSKSSDVSFRASRFSVRRGEAVASDRSVPPATPTDAALSHPTGSEFDQSELPLARTAEAESQPRVVAHRDDPRTDDCRFGLKPRRFDGQTHLAPH